MHTVEPKQVIKPQVFERLVLVECPRCQLPFRLEVYYKHVEECAKSQDSRFGHRPEN